MEKMFILKRQFYLLIYLTIFSFSWFLESSTINELIAGLQYVMGDGEKNFGYMWFKDFRGDGCRKVLLRDYKIMRNKQLDTSLPLRTCSHPMAVCSLKA